MILDDRKASPGVKFKDSELLGVPLDRGRRPRLGRRSVELRNRFTGESREIAVDGAAAEIAAALAA